MLGKLIVRSVVRSSTTWIALFISSIALSVVLSLNIGLVAAGAAAEGKAQQAFIAMGGVALGFTALTGFASFVLVVGICIRLQQRHVALWQLVGVMPKAAFSILLLEVLLVSVLSAVIGALVAIAVWPVYAAFVASSGLPQSDVLTTPLPLIALVIGVSLTATVSVVTGIRSALKVVQSNIVQAFSSSAAFPHEETKSRVRRIIAALTGALLILGVLSLYVTLSRAPEPDSAQSVGNFLTSYPGMGLLLCFVFAMLGGAVIPPVVSLLRLIPMNSNAWFLATREASARPRLTRSLVMPVSLAAAAVGVMTMWVGKLTAVFTQGYGAGDSVSAPPEQMALLLGGPIVVACVSAAAVVFATYNQRSEDNALLLVSGATPPMMYSKAITESVVYGITALVCACIIVAVNEVAMVFALKSGPVPVASFTAPGWQPVAVIVLGIVLVLIMLLVIAARGARKNSVSIVIGSK
ncbi:FtsX-like permease family protein [Corynebacterium ulcerans]|uniref:FtsX-like permease family protein n=1 Tax=Corynebacterium ulcerans TaxID=65058 RepID=UPI000218537C|nr:FtsX-like permease family protein [Corynebacterium ulcerans]AEG82172.1 putative membrane protein [Corynebacterium ulcerans 809]MBH5297893.1 FtsX-like permease family protein [Corynebacterium ulcerans]